MWRPEHWGRHQDVPLIKLLRVRGGGVELIAGLARQDSERSIDEESGEMPTDLAVGQFCQILRHLADNRGAYMIGDR